MSREECGLNARRSIGSGGDDGSDGRIAHRSRSLVHIQHQPRAVLLHCSPHSIEEVEAFFIDVAPCQLSVADVKEGSAMRGETLTLLEGCDESIAGGECRTTAEGSGVTCDVDIAA